MASSHAERRPIVSPQDQSATFIELFFDLVFVFALIALVEQLLDLLFEAAMRTPHVAAEGD